MTGIGHLAYDETSLLLPNTNNNTNIIFSNSHIFARPAVVYHSTSSKLLCGNVCQGGAVPLLSSSLTIFVDVVPYSAVL